MVRVHVRVSVRVKVKERVSVSVKVHAKVRGERHPGESRGLGLEADSRTKRQFLDSGFRRNDGTEKSGGFRL